MGQPYEYNTRQYEYYYDNDDNDYLLDEDIDYAKKSTPFRNAEDNDASTILEKLEKVKREARKESYSMSLIQNGMSSY